MFVDVCSQKLAQTMSQTMSQPRTSRRGRGRRGKGKNKSKGQNKNLQKIKSQSKFQISDDVNTAPNKFICIKCKLQNDINQRFTWTKCHHEYCVKCASNIMNESLSLSNEIPRCIYPSCIQLLSNEHADSIKFSLLSRYQIQLPIQHFDTNQFLIYGYTRENSQTLDIIPSDIIFAISNYVTIIYYNKIDCYVCQGYGECISNCTRCNGYGTSSYCECCYGQGYIQDEIDCNSCDMTGHIQCYNCKGNGSLRRICKTCDGIGYCYHDILDPEILNQEISVAISDLTMTQRQKTRVRLYCTDCKEKREKGYYDDPFNNRVCEECAGFGRNPKYLCKDCGGNGKITQRLNCWLCSGTGRKKGGNKDCLSCRKTGQIQSVCWLCNGNKQVVFLDLKKTCLNQTWCMKCYQWYPNNWMYRWSDKCGHQFCKKCMRNHMEDFGGVNGCMADGCNMKIGGILELYNDMFICRLCGLWKLKVGGDMFIWSGCHHKYCRKCVKNYVKKWFKIFPDIVPRCNQINCDKRLMLVDARKFGIQKEDYMKLKGVRNKMKLRKWMKPY